ncbi:NAD(P)-dependent alcohol dehydrogenase [Halorubrum vacuolatum]|uniref:Alcohol dehydrogenase, propanol-preferring n=1 Tax=Halorubrum vacuolatum TaxID=63740 RepID=A0A238ULX6_HALVU|nr:NAD(P)-dependent alcohol dehydrogenase [Halorubrum vacuolatum]SNR23035.1 alcohol dehydrogenase, propanol-preferring [Halorubrum vacuolatum]
MQAARLHEYTHEMSEALRIEEIDRPSATGNEVVVEVEGAGWCQTDNHVIEGMWEQYVPQELPMTLGHENAGTVVETGDAVSVVEEGERVICHPVMTCGTCRPCRLGEDMYCENVAFPGLTHDGGFAEYLLTNERAVIPLPGEVDPATIAPHADAGITAYHAAKKASKELNPGDVAVVIGVGGLGHIGVQCLDALTAADIVALDLKESARDLASDLGARYTLNPAEADVESEIDAISNGAGAQQIIDFVGRDETTALGPKIASPGGDHHVVGYGGHVHEPAQAFVNGEFAYRGTLVGKYTELQELVALVDRGDVDLHTSQYGLDDVNSVAEKLEHGEIDGRAVIVP